MALSVLRELSGPAAGLPAFLRRPTSLEEARSAVATRNENRGARFIDAAESLIYSREESPLRRLLAWAGCEPADLRREVEREGVEGALHALLRSGVYLTEDEFRGKVPIVRGNLTIETTAEDFDGASGSTGVRASTSGSTGAPLPVMYSWPFLAEEAENELLLLASHELHDARLALWLPGPPGIAGLHNQLLHARAGAPPQRWFSQTSTGEAAFPMKALALSISTASRFLRGFGPSPEWVPPEHAETVVRWMTSREPPSVLKSFASSIVRAGAVALQHGIDLSGHVAFAGGEPLSPRARETISLTGLRVFPRYVTTESGLIAGACPDQSQPDEMHVYTDRVALIAGEGAEAGSVHVTSLSPYAPKVLLNTSFGDVGTIVFRRCGCVLGESGSSVHVSGICSPSKVAAAGVKIDAGELLKLVERAIVDCGGRAEEFQLQIAEDAAGAVRIRMALEPSSAAGEEALLRRIRELLPVLRSGALAKMQWANPQLLNVVREPLRLSAGQKLFRVIGQDR